MRIIRKLPALFILGMLLLSSGVLIPNRENALPESLAREKISKKTAPFFTNHREKSNKPLRNTQFDMPGTDKSRTELKILSKPDYFYLKPYYPTFYKKRDLDLDYTYEIHGTTGEIRIWIMFNDPKIHPIKINNTEYYIIMLEGCGLSGEYGKPLLPTCSISVALPTHSKIREVSLDVFRVKYIGKYTPIPKQEPVPIGLNNKHPKFIIDEKTYSLSTLYPNDVLNEYSIGYMRGLPIVRITANPIQVVPLTGDAYLNARIIITVRFNLPKNYKTSTYDKKSAKFVKEILGASVIGISEAVEFSENVFRISSKLPTGSYDYLIITHDAYYDAAILYKTWKEEKGLNVTIANLSWILNNYAGVDNPEKIRNFIIDAYNTWNIEYVLIIGDADDVPPREVEDPYPYWGAPEIDNGTIPTDMYYACLDGDWNADNDTTWGEIEDNIDWYPELVVGRIPGDTIEEVRRAINRLILYEFAPATGDWRKKALLLGAQAFDYDDGAQFFNNMIQNYIQYTGYEPIKLYDTAESPNDNLTTENTISYIEGGVAIVNFWDHGSPTTWWQNVESTGGDPLISSYHVYNEILIEEIMYPFIFAMACSTVPFDHENMDDNMGESWFRTSIAGAIGYFGAARIAFAGDDGLDGLNERWWSFIKTYWEANRSQPTGWLIVKAKIDLTNDYDPDAYGNNVSRKTLLETAFLGDPELEMLVADNLTVTIENNTISVDPGQTFKIVGHVNRAFTNEGIATTVKVWILTGNIEIINSTIVTSYSNGTFIAELGIPSGTPPGKYILAVFAKSGDEIGRVGKVMRVGTLKVSVSCEPFVKLNHNVNITGRVLNKAGTPVGNAEVNITIIDAYGNTVKNVSVNTNTTGHYIYSWNTTVASEYEIHIVACDPTRAHWGINETSFIGAKGIIKVVVIDSWGSDVSISSTTFAELQENWYKYGEYAVEFDRESLNKDGITLSDIINSSADILFISDAWNLDYGWEFTDEEINAIKHYVLAGHGIIGTGGTLSSDAPNNMKLAEIFGYASKPAGNWGSEFEPTFNILNESHPIFAGVTLPYETGMNYTVTGLELDPSSPATILAKSTDEQAQISEHIYGGGMAIYFTHMPEVNLPAYGYTPTIEDYIVLYNAVVYAYEESSLTPYEFVIDKVEAPLLIDIGETALINATVINVGYKNATDILVRLIIDKEEKDSQLVDLPSMELVNITFSYSPTQYRVSDVTISVDIIPEEADADNNNKSTIMIVARKIYENDFETDPTAEWNITGSNSSWEWGKPTSGPRSAYSGQYCWATNLAGEYNNDENSTLVSPEIQIPANASNVYVLFYHWFNIEKWFDSARLMINNGTGWYLVEPIMGIEYSEAKYGRGWTGENKEWTPALFDIAKFRGQTIRLGFNFTSDSSITYDGWYVDDLIIAYIAYEHQLCIDGIYMNHIFVYHETRNITVAIANYGNSSETGVNVRLYINGTEWGSETIDIGSMKVKNVTFTLTINESLIGILNIKVVVEPVPGEYVTEDNEAEEVAYGGTYVYENDFEIDPTAEWIISGSNSSWEWGEPTSGPGSAHSGTKVWATNLDGDYNNDEDSQLIKVFNDLKYYYSVSKILVIFHHWYYIESGFDYAWFEVSYDGNTWIKLSPMEGPEYEEKGWSGSSNGWVKTIFDITNYVKEDKNLYIAFHFSSDYSVNYDGWYIDDVKVFVTAISNHDIVVSAIQVPEVIEYCENITINTTIFNNGIENETNVVIDLLVNDVLVDTTVISEIKSKESIIVSFNWTVSILGPINITVYANPVLNEDILGNNMKSKIVLGLAFIIEYDFEADPGFEWSIMGTASSWEWGEPTSGPGSAHSGTKVWATNLDGDYNNDEDSYLVLNFSALPITFNEGDSIYVILYIWYYIENRYDGARVEVSYDLENWIILYPIAGPEYSSTYYYGDAWTGKTSSWMETMFNLTGMGSNIYFGFHMMSDSSANYAGVYIDDLSVGSSKYPKVLIISPENDTYAPSSTTVNWTTFGSKYVNHFEIYVDGVPINTSIPSTETSYTITGLLEGPHTIEVRMIDLIGRVSSSITNIYVDLTPPIISIESPENNSYTNQSSIIMSWSASDDYGIDHFEIYVDDEPVDTNISNDTYSYALNLSEGEHIIVVKAIDIANNIGSDSISIFVDTVAPSIENIEYPKEIFLGSAVEFIANVSDTEPSSGIKVVYLYYSFDNKTWSFIEMELANGSYVATLNISEEKVWIRVVAVDKASNVGKSDVILIEAQAPPSTTSYSLILLFMIIGAIIVLAFMLRRKKKVLSEESTEMPVEESPEEPSEI